MRPDTHSNRTRPPFRTEPASSATITAQTTAHILNDYLRYLFVSLANRPCRSRRRHCGARTLIYEMESAPD